MLIFIKKWKKSIYESQFFSKKLDEQFLYVFDNGELVKIKAKRSFDSFNQREVKILKLADWPHTDSLRNVLVENYDDFIKSLPVKKFSSPLSMSNIVTNLPENLCSPDFGAKVYAGYKNTRWHFGCIECYGICESNDW